MPTRELWKRIGTVPLDEAIGIILDQRTRYGAAVSTQSVSAAAKRNPANAEVLAEALRVISPRIVHLSRSKRSCGARLALLEKQREILTAMQKYGDRRLHASELVAALVLTHGLGKEQLRPHLNAAIRLQKQLTHPPFDGSVNSFSQAITNDGLKRIYQKLHADPTYYASALELAEKLKLEKREMVPATAILDLAGAVHKLPFDSASRSYIWMHASGKPPAPIWHHNYNALVAAITAGQPVNGPYLVQAAGLDSLGVVIRLEKQGLLTAVSGRQSNMPLFKVNPLIEDSVRETHRSGVLHRDLNRVLLGSFEVDRPLLSPHQEEALLKEIRFRLAFQERTDRPIAALALLHGLNRDTASCYARGVRTGLRNFSVKKVLGVADQWTKKGWMHEADFLRIAASLNREKIIK
ncbi:MAG: hypothetical protein V1722_05765 [Candidatus Micrarchaeota archaeon]